MAEVDRRQPLAYVAASIGPAAWLLSTGLNYAFSAFCWNAVIVATALLLAVVSAIGGLASWRLGRTRPELVLAVDEPTAFLPYRSVAAFGVAAGVLFAVIIVLQGTAVGFVGACVR